MELDTAKGVRDFPPEEKILRQELVEKLRKVFERYGFSPLETPTFERYEVLAAKFGAGEESDALKETFTFEDQGKRKLGLRFDLTVPLARFVGMNPRIKFPFKRYQIGRTYRDGPIKLGRYREFWQCDVDIVGCPDMKADAEIIRLSLDVFEELGLDAYIEVNSRKLLDGIMEYAGIPEDKRESAIIAVDKLKKFGEQNVIEEMQQNEIPNAQKLIELFKKDIGYFENLDNKKLKQGISDLKEIQSYVKDNNLVINTSLARGLAYYTGTVFEGYLRNSEITSSICGGGRYDNMIGQYRNTEKQYPAVGISFGMEPIIESIKLEKKNFKKTVTQVYIIPIDAYDKALEILNKLRKKWNSDIDMMERGISKNLEYADKMKIPYVIIVGKRDLEEGVLTLKNMKSGDEEKIPLENVDQLKFE